MVTITLSDEQAKRLAEFIGYSLLNDHIQVLYDVARKDPDSSLYSIEELNKIDSDLRSIFVDQLGYALVLRGKFFEGPHYWVEKIK